MNTKGKAYGSFTKYGNKYVAEQDRPSSTTLPPGIYTTHFDQQRGLFWFQETTILSDEILNLPSGEFNQVTQEINNFLTQEKKELFKKYGYIYKRSALLHGLPGTGKTIIVQRLARDVINKGGIVIYVDNPSILEMGYSVLKDVAPDTFKLVVFEEFDRMTERYEEILLSLLDGEVQQDNVVYLATTNYIDKIPARLRRPGRFSSVIEVDYPSFEAREFYLNSKLKNKKLVKSLAEQTKGLSIDELKEVIQAHVILDLKLDSVLDRIRLNKNQGVFEEKPKKMELRGFIDNRRSLDEPESNDEFNPEED